MAIPVINCSTIKEWEQLINIYLELFPYNTKDFEAKDWYKYRSSFCFELNVHKSKKDFCVYGKLQN